MGEAGTEPQAEYPGLADVILNTDAGTGAPDPLEPSPPEGEPTVRMERPDEDPTADAGD